MLNLGAATAGAQTHIYGSVEHSLHLSGPQLVRCCGMKASRVQAAPKAHLDALCHAVDLILKAASTIPQSGCARVSFNPVCPHSAKHRG